MTHAVTTRAALPSDLDSINNLQSRVFGPGRFARSAYRIREGTPSVTRYCRVAERDGQLIASLRMTAIAIGGKTGAVLLGPLAVDPDHRGEGYGHKLVADALDVCRAADCKLVILVGDMPYYGRFGFKPAPPGQIALPGPVNPARILICELSDGAGKSYHGLVTADIDGNS